MAEFDLHSNIKVVPAIPPEVFTAIKTGTTVDTLGYESCEFVYFSGVLGTGVADSVWATVGAADVLGSVDGVVSMVNMIATDDDATFRTGYIGKKRYVRVNLLETSAFTSFILGVIAILGNPKERPVAAQNT